MKIFLIEYDRKSGRRVSMRVFPASQRRAAEDARLDLELRLHRQSIEREVVLLEAPNEDALKRTHGRYFGGSQSAAS